MIKHFVFSVIVFHKNQVLFVLIMYFLSLSKIIGFHTREGLCKSFKKVKCVSKKIASRNTNEVINVTLNFFTQKFHNRIKHKTLTSEQK